MRAVTADHGRKVAVVHTGWSIWPMKGRNRLAGFAVMLSAVARLDLADEPTYQALLTALEDRSERFTRWMPHLDF